MISNYFYLKHTATKRYRTLDAFLDIIESGEESETFNKHVIHQHPCYMFDGKQFVDFIGRYEHLGRDWKTVSGHIGLKDTTLPLSNKTRHKDYKTYYNKTQMARVHRIYETDITSLKYSFE